MVGAPAFAKTKIAIAKRASDRDVPDIGQAAGRGGKRRRGRLQRFEPARHLAGLMVEPFLLVMLACAPSRLVDREDRGVENAVGERLQPQGGEPRGGFARNDLAAAGALVEEFEDDSRIIISGAV